MRMSTFGISLVALGILMFSYTQIDIVTTKKVVDIGPININKEEGHLVQWPRMAGIVLVLGGIALTMKGRRRPV